MQHQDTLAAFADFFDQMGAKEIESLRRAHDIFAALDPGELAGLSDALDIVQQDPRQYSEFRRIMREEGDVGEDVLPERYDPSSMLLMNALTKSAMGRPARQGFALGGSPTAGPSMARQGLPTLLQQAQEPIYGTDTITAHITPGEAHLLQARGGAGVINQQTGNPQYFLRSIGSALSGVARGIGKAMRTVAPIAIGLGATFVLGPAGLGLSPMMAGALGGGLSTLFTGGSPSDALRSAAIGGALGGLTGGFGGREAGAAASNAQATAGVPASAAGVPATAAVTPTAGRQAGLATLGRAAEAGSGALSLDGARTLAAVPGGAAELTSQGLSGEALRSAAQASAAPLSLPQAAAQEVVQPGLMDRARNIWDTYLSPGRDMPTNDQLFARATELQQQSSGQLAFDQAVQMAQQELTPGMLSRYGPLAGLGIGAVALTGGFRSDDGPAEQIAADERARFEQFTPPPGGFSIFSGGVPRYQQPAFETVGGLDMSRQPRMYAASGGIADVARVRLQAGGTPLTRDFTIHQSDMVNWANQGELPLAIRRAQNEGWVFSNLRQPTAARTQTFTAHHPQRMAEQQQAAPPPPPSPAPAPAPAPSASFAPAPAARPAAPPPPLPAARPLFPGSDTGVPQTPAYVPPAFDVSASPYVSAGAGFGGAAPNIGGSYDDAVRRAQQYFSSMQPGGELIDPADAVMVPPMPTQGPAARPALAALPPLLPQEAREMYAAGGSPWYQRRY